MKILKEETRYRFGRPFTLVMTEGCVNDVAVYAMSGVCNPYDVAAHGLKLTEHSNTVDGIPIPEGKHYRR